VLKVKQTNGHMLQTAQGTYRDDAGYYYQVYDFNNGFNGCVDWTEPLFARDLSFLSTGYDVLLLQRALVRLGFAAYTQSGYFGTLTLLSVRAYQKSLGLPATGYCGPLTRAKLNAIYSQLG
jgi:hypothetical protein